MDDNRSSRFRIGLNGLAGLAPSNGSRVYLLELARALLRQPQVDLVLFTARGEVDAVPPELRRAAYEVDVPAGRSYQQILHAPRIARAVRESAVECWHLPNTLPLISRPCPTVITIHDVLDLRIRKYGLLRTAYRWLINYVAAQRADKIVTVSNCSKRDIANYLRVPLDKIVVIYPGVDEMFSPHSEDESRQVVARHYGIKHFFLCPGGIARNKNIQVAVRALALFQQRTEGYSLLVTGEGSSTDAAALYRLVHSLGLDSQVIQVGCVPRTLMPSLYRAASAVVYPSLYEGFGLPILEGMACGCPVITSNASSLPEVAGDAAICIDPHNPTLIADAMHEVTSNRTLRERFIAAGLERARFFSWDRTASTMCTVYRDASASREQRECSGQASTHEAQQRT